ncbi:MAG: DUF6427 family protein [bacterium]
MLIRYFKSSFPVQFITIGIVGVVLWGIAFADPPRMPVSDGPVPLYSFLYRWLADLPYLTTLGGLLLVLFESFFLNYIFSRHDLVHKNSTLAAFLFLLFISYLPPWLSLTPVNLSVVFLLFIVRALLKAYNQTEPIGMVYTAGFFVGMASLFYFPSLLLYGFLLVCFLIYREFHWREWISSLIGLATPFLFLGVIYFLIDKLPGLSLLYLSYMENPGFSFPSVTRMDWLLIGLLGVAALLGLWSTLSRIGEKTVELRKKNLVLLWLLGWLFVAIIYANTLHFYHLGMISVCLAPFVSNFYLNLRKPFWFQFLLWLMILAVFANTALFYIS